VLTAALLDLDWLAQRAIGRGLRRDAIDPDGADPGAPASFTTSVIRLPADLAARLEGVAASLAETQPGQYLCPAGTIHVTVCGPLPASGGPGDDEALADLRVVAPRLAGGRLRVVRLGLGDTSVFAALEAEGADLLGIRRELAARWGVAGRPGIGGAIASRLLWANLVRFSVPASPALRAAVGRVRRPVHAGVPIEAVELVRTNRAMSPERTTVLGRVDVAAGHSGRS